ncbi:hypothetical protein GCM10010492_43660 [Saccharothrix mutabilis subsp. mutabilis]|uniref:Uncharacterized protein n=1 Tax=Saccharothrix mutabilis subsp. mutabilis TaxID=66855 RepID=A0ABP3DUA0_9PSEU
MGEQQFSALRQAADDVDDAVAGARENVANSLEPSSTAASANRGWLSSGALAECRQAWSDHLVGVIERTAEALDDLHWEAE